MPSRMRTAAAAVSLAAVAGFAGPAAAKTIDITVASGAPEPVTFVSTFKNIVSKRINQRLKAEGHDLQINWNHAYGQTLAKLPEVFEAVEEGIAGAGLLLKNFEPSNLPLESYAVYTPFIKMSRQQLTQIDDDLHKKIPAMMKAYTDHNQIFLQSGDNDSMQMFTTFPIRKFSDLKGKKIGASGSFAQWFRGTGAVAVNSSMTDSYTNIKNGVYDGIPVSIILSFVFKSYAAAPDYTRVDFGPTVSSALTFNMDTWKSLPGYARKIIREEAAKWPHEQDVADAKKRGKFTAIMKKKGVKFATLADSERKKWAMAMPNIAKEWAKRLDAKGQPGTKLLTTYMDELRARNIPIARQWDKE